MASRQAHWEAAPARRAVPSSSWQQPAMSASEQLQSYIDRFEKSQAAESAPPVHNGFTRRSKKNDDKDAWDLLCGRHGASDGHVSVKTRCILRDVERKLGYTEPCYSAQDRLDLRSIWPSMHEHLERRWRRQLRERYEAQQRAEAAAAATAAEASAAPTCTGGTRRSRLPTSLTPQSEAPPARVQASADSDDEDKTVECSDSGRDGGGGGSSLAVGATDAARCSKERLWGSDSGIEQSCSGAAAVTAATATAAAATWQSDNKVSSEAEATDDPSEVGGSFEERMRSYRCVLEAHELSSRLRQHLEAACATTGNGGKKVLSVEEKGRIRDRLARLQGPLRGGFIPSDDGEADREQPPQPEPERITTERLAQLMSLARGLLPSRVEEAEEDRRWPVLDDAAVEAGQEPGHRRLPGSSEPPALVDLLAELLSRLAQQLRLRLGQPADAHVLLDSLLAEQQRADSTTFCLPSMAHSSECRKPWAAAATDNEAEPAPALACSTVSAAPRTARVMASSSLAGRRQCGSARLSTGTRVELLWPPTTGTLTWSNGAPAIGAQGTSAARGTLLFSGLVSRQSSASGQCRATAELGHCAGVLFEQIGQLHAELPGPAGQHHHQAAVAQTVGQLLPPALIAADAGLGGDASGVQRIVESQLGHECRPLQHEGQRLADSSAGAQDGHPVLRQVRHAVQTAPTESADQLTRSH
uniref:HA domain-containing protein n=1 Tax=Macrostomum lignano TaxID=282301 RepID=A0A1I8FSI1_9PLAT